MTKSFMAACVLVALLATGGPPVLAQTADEASALRSEIEALKKGQEEMRKDLAVIRKILEGAARGRAQARVQPPFQPVDMTVGASPFLGEEAAPVTLIEYSDYQCPYCKRHFTRVMPQLVKAYVESGKLKYVMREFPIDSIHPQAAMASQAALCAGEQGKYWQMHDLIFGAQKRMSPDVFREHAASIGLDAVAFSGCLEDNRYAAQVRRDQAEGQKLGVRGTPSFVLGATDPTDPNRLRATKFIRGAQPLAVFSQAIEELLSETAMTVGGKS